MKWLILAALLFTSCVTPYQPKAWAGGYEDEYLGDDTYMIIVKVNGFSGMSTAYNHFHRRAREIVADNGYTRYEVIEAESSTKTSVHKKKDGRIAVSPKPSYFGRIKCYRD